MRSLITTVIIAILGLCTVATTSAQAKEVGCWLSINGERTAEVWDDSDPVVLYSQSLFEKTFGVPKLEYATCPGLVVLRQMTPGLTDTQRDPFCLVYDQTTGSYSGFEVGLRDMFLNCKKPSRSYCQFVEDSQAEAIRLTEVAAATLTATGGASVAAGTAGVTAVTHSSGAVILTGSSGYIAGTLGTVGTTMVSVLTAPAVIGAAAVTAVVAGGSVYICS